MVRAAESHQHQGDRGGAGGERRRGAAGHRAAQRPAGPGGAALRTAVVSWRAWPASR